MIFVQENEFEIAVRKMTTILSRPQCVEDPNVEDLQSP